MKLHPLPKVYLGIWYGCHTWYALRHRWWREIKNPLRYPRGPLEEWEKHPDGRKVFREFWRVYRMYTGVIHCVNCPNSPMESGCSFYGFKLEQLEILDTIRFKSGAEMRSDHRLDHREEWEDPTEAFTIDCKQWEKNGRMVTEECRGCPAFTWCCAFEPTPIPYRIKEKCEWIRR